MIRTRELLRFVVVFAMEVVVCSRGRRREREIDDEGVGPYAFAVAFRCSLLLLRVEMGSQERIVG